MIIQLCKTKIEKFYKRQKISKSSSPIAKLVQMPSKNKEKEKRQKEILESMN